LRHLGHVVDHVGLILRLSGVILGLSWICSGPATGYQNSGPVLNILGAAQAFFWDILEAVFANLVWEACFSSVFNFLGTSEVHFRLRLIKFWSFLDHCPDQSFKICWANFGTILWTCRSAQEKPGQDGRRMGSRSLKVLKTSENLHLQKSLRPYKALKGLIKPYKAL